MSCVSLVRGLSRTGNGIPDRYLAALKFNGLCRLAVTDFIVRGFSSAVRQCFAVVAICREAAGDYRLRHALSCVAISRCGGNIRSVPMG